MATRYARRGRFRYGHYLKKMISSFVPRPRADGPFCTSSSHAPGRKVLGSAALSARPPPRTTAARASIASGGTGALSTDLSRGSGRWDIRVSHYQALAWSTSSVHTDTVVYARAIFLFRCFIGYLAGHAGFALFPQGHGRQHIAGQPAHQIALKHDVLWLLCHQRSVCALD